MCRRGEQRREGGYKEEKIDVNSTGTIEMKLLARLAGVVRVRGSRCQRRNLEECCTRKLNEDESVISNICVCRILLK